ncbi:thiol reductant ABC exporter subunit CydC [Domibacillus robiginosus]|uniref:thiol reductant ABC exporter subunit CydC n=1 Tax=Domibacillus robiginosus TaxID=1071054 RepID=UPI00067E0D6C|nr:thiol reductant ABC exporter subunit CydC [Domibacillus robiginosus]
MKNLGFVIKILLIEKKDIFYSIICGFISGITAVSLFASSGYLISKAALAPPIYTLMLLVASIKLLGIISAVSRYGERYFSHRGTFTMLSNMRVSFYEQLEPLAPTIFQKYRSGDLLARIVGDVEALQNFFLRVFYPPVVLILVFLCTIFFTAFFSIEVALIVFIGLMLTTFIVPAFFALKQRKVDRQVRQKRGELSTKVTEFLYGFRDLKIHQQLEEKEEQLRQSVDTYLEEQKRESIHNLFSQSANTFISLLISLLVLSIGAYLVAEGQLDGIFLAMLVMISLTVFENTTSMAAFPSYLEESRQAASRLNAVVGKDIARETSQESIEERSIQGIPSIEVKDVTFAFPDEIRNTLTGVNLMIPAGSKTAIVGPSGSGKSTLLQLLLKFYTVNPGRICFNNHPINHVSQECIWENTNVVLQENHFFYGTIRDNLLLAKDEVSDTEMEEVLGKVKLGHFSLNDRVLEKGENLSGGEKQRLAISRALLKKAPLWLLDEPTSSIDALTEAHIFGHLFEEAKDDTVILISHRLTGLEKMDQIIVMDHGSIVEIGTFEELMDKKGYFYEMKQIEQSVFFN